MLDFAISVTDWETKAIKSFLNVLCLQLCLDTGVDISHVLGGDHGMYELFTVNLVGAISIFALEGFGVSSVANPAEHGQHQSRRIECHVCPRPSVKCWCLWVPLHFLLSLASMWGEDEANRVGFFAGNISLSLDGLVNPY